MIAIGADHAGRSLVRYVIDLLDHWENCFDRTADSSRYRYVLFNANDGPQDDYPVIAKEVADAVMTGEFERGILICGTGIGMGIAANKVKGVRAAVCNSYKSCERIISHNYANILCMGAQVVPLDDVLDIVRTFLDTKFSGEERHVRRITQIREMET